MKIASTVNVSEQLSLTRNTQIQQVLKQGPIFELPTITPPARSNSNSALTSGLGMQANVLLKLQSEQINGIAVTNGKAEHIEAAGESTEEGVLTDKVAMKKIMARYSSKPMTTETFCDMLNEMTAAGLISGDLAWEALGCAGRRLAHETCVRDDAGNPMSFVERVNYTINFYDVMSFMESQWWNPTQAQEAYRKSLTELFTELAQYMQQEDTSKTVTDGPTI